MQKITLASLTTLTLLCASSIHLDWVEVTTPSNTPQKLHKTTTAVEIISDKQLNEKEYINVNDALNSLGGVDIQSAGGPGSQSSVTINGLSGKNVLILIDGVSYNDPSTLNNTAPLEHLLLSNIQRIEILKGSQSAAWGANASGGVINIITKTPSKGVHGALHLS
ncbi:MAG: TonB-dependent receptor, partial [Campylobacterales bacterium]|nr:TonB-dependent receptor [Campylobacterales bacterium]